MRGFQHCILLIRLIIRGRKTRSAEFASSFHKAIAGDDASLHLVAAVALLRCARHRHCLALWLGRRLLPRACCLLARARLLRASKTGVDISLTTLLSGIYHHYLLVLFMYKTCFELLASLLIIFLRETAMIHSTFVVSSDRVQKTISSTPKIKIQFFSQMACHDLWTTTARRASTFVLWEMVHSTALVSFSM